MNASEVGKKIYNIETIIRSYSDFSISRSLYNQLRKDFKLPSVKTLTKITSRAKNVSDIYFISTILSNIEENHRNCILLVDEVYIKSFVLYHGGSLFGKAENNPELLSNTVLGIMIKCFKGRPSFLCKMIPACHLDASFFFSSIFILKNVVFHYFFELFY